MMTRTTTTAVAGRASSMRRLRRRARADLYCRTNGCASFLTLDPATGRASCEICGYSRTIGS
jgi:hypothetical protein